MTVTPRLTYIVAILNIKEAPEAIFGKSSCSTSVLLDYLHRHNGIDDRKPSVEGQLRNLRSLQFPVCIPELHNGFVILCRKSICSNTVISRPFDWVIHRLGVFQVDRLGDHGVFCCFRRVGIEYEFPNLRSLAEGGLYTRIVADECFLSA